jgi:hypothetical protein
MICPMCHRAELVHYDASVLYPYPFNHCPDCESSYPDDWTQYRTLCAERAQQAQERTTYQMELLPNL